MTDEIHQGQPPASSADKGLIEAYQQEPIKQAEYLNDIVKELLKPADYKGVGVIFIKSLQPLFSLACPLDGFVRLFNQFDLMFEK